MSTPPPEFPPPPPSTLEPQAERASFPPPSPPPPSLPPFPPAPARRKKSAARWLVPLGLLFLFVAFAGGLGLLLLGAMAGGERLTEGSILELKLREGLREAPDPVGALFPSLAGPPSLFEIRKALERAAGDGNIAGLRLEIDSLELGWGEAAELAAAIDAFKRSSKPVHAYLGGEFVSDIDYAVAMAADKVWIAPLTTVAVNGLQAEIEFWRGTLDKLHVEPQFFTRSEYKTAGETYMRHELSEPSRESIQQLLDEIWTSFLDDLARRRKVDAGAARAAADRGLLRAEEAVAARWIDSIGYPDALEKELAKEHRYRGVSARKYLRLTGAAELLGGASGTRLAVVFGEGPIVSSPPGGLFDDSFHGPAVALAIRRAADDEAVKGILFRVNSPGGSPVGSDYVWRAVEYARKERKKPVVVSMSSVAASGGYWVAMNADSIVARPSTMTGSIGVVFGKINALGLFRLAGANVDTVKAGENADILSFVRSFDERQIATIDAWLDSTYAEFKGKVGSGRNLPPEKVEEVARGRVWSGLAARERGLVDQLGGYDEAIVILRDKAGIARDATVSLVVYPRQKSFFEALLEEEEPPVDLQAARTWLDPQAQMRRALEELGRPGAWLLAPPIQVR